MSDQLRTEWQQAGVRFCKARKHYLATDARLDTYRADLVKKNMDPREDFGYRIQRKASRRIGRIYSDCWDLAQHAWQRYNASIPQCAWCGKLDCQVEHANTWAPEGPCP